jgi:hypothetical protein
MKKYPSTPEELREWMERKGLSNKDVAKALRLPDARTFKDRVSRKDPRLIPYPNWYTLRHKFRKWPLTTNPADATRSRPAAVGLCATSRGWRSAVRG